MSPIDTNCQKVRSHLSNYFDGEVDSQSSLEIQQHLHLCDGCSSELTSFRALRVLLREMASQTSEVSFPTWEVIASRLADPCKPTPIVVVRAVRHWKFVGGFVAIAASLLVIANLRFVFLRDSLSNRSYDIAHSHDESKSDVPSMDLQPVLELFDRSPELALQLLTDQFPSRGVAMDQLDTIFGRPTFVSTSTKTNSLPGEAKIVSSQLWNFPLCKCPDGACTCGPSGCNCVACICERPDGSIFLVLEHCKSQSISFGGLPVRLVDRGHHLLQEVIINGAHTVSWERAGGRLTAIGLRNTAEIETLLASN